MARSLVHRAAAAYQSHIQRTIPVRSYLIGHGRHDDEDGNNNGNNRGRNDFEKEKANLNKQTTSTVSSSKGFFANLKDKCWTAISTSALGILILLGETKEIDEHIEKRIQRIRELELKLKNNSGAWLTPTITITSCNKDEIKYMIPMPGMDQEHCTYGWDIEGMLLTVRGNNGDEEYKYTREVPRRFRHGQVTFESLTLGNLIVSVKVKKVAMGSRSYQNSHLKRELENFNEQRCDREVTEIVASYLTALTLDKVVLDQGNDVANTDASSYLKTLSILDIGTHDGLLLQKLARNGFSQLTGTDSSDEAVKAAQQLAKCNGFPNIKFLVDDILKTNLKGQFCLINDIKTLDAIGQLHDGPVKRITYWETVSRLVAPGGLVVITTFCHTRDQLVQEVEKFNQLKARTPQETKAPGETKSYNNSRIFSYVDHTYPAFNSGGSVGSRVATVAFMRS